MKAGQLVADNGEPANGVEEEPTEDDLLHLEKIELQVSLLLHREGPLEQQARFTLCPVLAVRTHCPKGNPKFRDITRKVGDTS